MKHKSYAQRQLDYIEACCPIDCRPIIKKEIRGGIFLAQIYKENIPHTSTRLLLDYYIWGEEPEHIGDVLQEIERRGITDSDIEKAVNKAIKKLLKLEGNK